jgi:thioredoxin-like negative regulator of GroEL
MFSPIIDKVAQKYPVDKVNVEEKPELAEHYNVKKVPTTILVDDGNELTRHIGVASEDTIVDMFHEHEG